MDANKSNICETGISIRRMRQDDILDIERIYAQITQQPLQAKFKELAKTPGEQTDSGTTCFVAELKGTVVGFMISHVLTFSFGLEKSAWIATMGVDPKYMGQQLGAQLADEICKLYKSQGITNLYTSVQWDATDVVSFFKKMGFHRSDFINLQKVL